MHPQTDMQREQKLVSAWETFKRSQPKAVSDSAGRKNDYQDAFDENETPLPGIIDINTADSATLVRLKGIGPVTAGRIVAHRKMKGPFTSVDQLQEVGTFTDATFEVLKKHLTAGASQKNK